jgi:hypothetical protein
LEPVSFNEKYWQSQVNWLRFNPASFNQNLDEIGIALSDDLMFNKPTLFIRGAKSHYILDSDFADIAFSASFI